MATNERPNRLVMGLGIATVILFSANLLAMLSQQVWPQLHEALFASKAQVEKIAPEVEIEEAIPKMLIETTAPTVSVSETIHIVRPTSKHMVYRFLFDSKRRRRCRTHWNHRLHSHSILSTRDALDLDAEKLERDIEREMERLHGDMSEMDRDLEQAMTIHLDLDGLNGILVRKQLDLSNLEKELEEVSNTFRIRFQQHEAASKLQVAAKLQVMEQANDTQRPRVIVRDKNQR